MIDDIMIRPMNIDDYDGVISLWMTIRGFGIRSIDDSREGIERFLLRNPNTSIVAQLGDEIVGSILCGHDGRQACFYHVCVKQELRRHGIGKAMAITAMEQLRKEHINKITLIAFKSNEEGNSFWQRVNWSLRDDINTYEFVLNSDNNTTFNN